MNISNCAFAATIASSAQELVALHYEEPDVLYACYAPYSWNDEEQGASGSYWYLTCDKDVTIITQKEETKKEDTSSPTTTTVSQPAPAAPAEPITITKAPASTKAKAKKNKVTVTWKKIKKSKKTKAVLGQIKSIQVQYSTDPNFATDVNTKTVSKKKTKITLKLQRKTQYYVRVRYVGTDGFSNWGTVKAVKTK